MAVGLSRAYDPPGAGDGWRVLVDRVWPRGVRKAELRLDEWAKDAAPTPALREWYGHDPAKWDEFRRRYWRELDGRPDVVAALRARAAAGPLTLVYGARDRAHSHALALRDYLLRPEEPASYASPPCFMHELDPEWVGGGGGASEDD
jgi:uncharacterized protein YeaO (DUF488 family)